MGMFCYQCQEAAKGIGCNVRGVCGKTEEVAKLQDLLIYTLKGISEIVVKGNLSAENLADQSRSCKQSFYDYHQCEL
jgi:hydroxylamine reductase